MKKINGLILKKRFYLFFLLIFTTFLMNIYLWNEPSRLIQELPNLLALKANISDDIYEIQSIPFADETGLGRSYSGEEINKIDTFLEESFFDEPGNSKLYSRKKTILMKRPPKVRPKI